MSFPRFYSCRATTDFTWEDEANGRRLVLAVSFELTREPGFSSVEIVQARCKSLVYFDADDKEVASQPPPAVAAALGMAFEDAVERYAILRESLEIACGAAVDASEESRRAA